MQPYTSQHWLRQQLTSVRSPYCDKENPPAQTQKAISSSIVFKPETQGRAAKEIDYKSFMLKDSIQMVPAVMSRIPRMDWYEEG